MIGIGFRFRGCSGVTCAIWSPNKNGDTAFPSGPSPPLKTPTLKFTELVVNFESRSELRCDLVLLLRYLEERCCRLHPYNRLQNASFRRTSVDNRWGFRCLFDLSFRGSIRLCSLRARALTLSLFLSFSRSFFL